MKLHADLLRTDAFTWQGALLLALASKLAYEDGKAVESIALDSWGFNACEILDVGDTQGFLAAAPGVTMVAFRGTESIGDWLGNLDLRWSVWPPFGSVHNGFLAAYGLVRDRVSAFIARQPRPTHIWLTGHSLGGALATIAAAEVNAATAIGGVCTFGQPRLADSQVVQFFAASLRNRFHRLVNDDDLVTRVPPGFNHVGKLIHFDADGNVRRSATEAETETAPLERPPLTPERFEEMQREIRSVIRNLEAMESTARKRMLDSSVEGLFPSLGDHKIERYVALVRRQVGDATIESAPPRKGTGDPVAFPIEGTGGAQDYVPVVIRLRRPDWSPPSDIKVHSRIGNIVSARATRAAIEGLRKEAAVSSVQPSREAGERELDAATSFVGANVIQRPPIDERGDKAIIGIIDSGVDVLHECFLDGQGRSRILAIWDQTTSGGPSPATLDPAGFGALGYGTLYLAADIARFIAAPATVPEALRDPGCHGTHVASIAAGRGINTAPGTLVDGMAPEARLVVVIPDMRTAPGNPPSLGYSVSHIDALHFLKRVSGGGTAILAERLPIAINVSLGMNAGAHDGSSALETAFDRITDSGQEKGCVIVKSAGNERGRNGHVRLKAAQGGRMSIEWESAISDRFEDYMEVWYSAFDDLVFWLVGPGDHKTLELSEDNPAVDVVLGTARCILELTKRHPDNGNSRLTISIRRDTGDIMPGRWKLTFEGRSVISRDYVDAWVERDGHRAVSFLSSDNNMTLSIPGTARHVITVGACNSRLDQLQLTDRSSFGPTRDGQAKPDMCAPGSEIVAARAGTARGTRADTGTSMAAPIVTGALALVMSRRHKLGQPQLNARQLYAALVRSTKNFNGIHHEGYGYGPLDALRFFQSLE